MPAALPAVVRDIDTQRNFDALNNQVGSLGAKFPIALADQAAGVRLYGVVTALPKEPTPAPGDTCFYVADKTNGVVLWNLVYDGEGELPWKFLGGPPLFNTQLAGQATTSASYTGLATKGPEVKTPLKGDYDVRWGAHAWNNTANCHARMGISVGGAEPTIEVDMNQPTAGAFAAPALSREERLTKLAAGTLLLARYRQISGGEASFANRWLALAPVRVG